MHMMSYRAPRSLADVQAMVQTAIDLEFSTLPPYLYAKMTILPGSNAAAIERLDMIVEQEMIHMCLACNILNAIGGVVQINPPHYPGPLPGGVDASETINLWPFSPTAMQQGMSIEEPDNPVQPPGGDGSVPPPPPHEVTIGEYYALVDQALAALDPGVWVAGRNQVSDSQFFSGQLFEVNNYADAHKAITQIVSEGEGTPVNPSQTGSPLDFQNELAHYYRFEEIYLNQVLTKDPGNPGNPTGYRWGGPLGVDWTSVYPAIPNPQTHDFSEDPPEAQAAQAACNAAYAAMVQDLEDAFRGGPAGLGGAVRRMFQLRMAAIKALTTPLKDGISVAGPAFLYR